MKKRLIGTLYTLLGLGLALLVIWTINKFFLDHEINFETEDIKNFSLPDNLKIENELEQINKAPGLENRN